MQSNRNGDNEAVAFVPMNTGTASQKRKPENSAGPNESKRQRTSYLSTQPVIDLTEETNTNVNQPFVDENAMSDALDKEKADLEAEALLLKKKLAIQQKRRENLQLRNKVNDLRREAGLPPFYNQNSSANINSVSQVPSVSMSSSTVGMNPSNFAFAPNNSNSNTLHAKNTSTPTMSGDGTSRAPLEFDSEEEVIEIDPEHYVQSSSAQAPQQQSPRNTNLTPKNLLPSQVLPSVADSSNSNSDSDTQISAEQKIEIAKLLAEAQAKINAPISENSSSIMELPLPAVSELISADQQVAINQLLQSASEKIAKTNAAFFSSHPKQQLQVNAFSNSTQLRSDVTFGGFIKK